jgi:hypothetical protein
MGCGPGGGQGQIPRDSTDRQDYQEDDEIQALSARQESHDFTPHRETDGCSPTNSMEYGLSLQGVPEIFRPICAADTD